MQQTKAGLQCTTCALLSGQGLDARILVRGHERVVRALDGLEPHRGLLRIVVVLVRMPHLPRRLSIVSASGSAFFQLRFQGEPPRPSTHGVIR